MVFTGDWLASSGVDVGVSADAAGSGAAVSVTLAQLDNKAMAAALARKDDIRIRGDLL